MANVPFAPLSVSASELLENHSPEWLKARVGEYASLAGLVYPGAAAAGLAHRHTPDLSPALLISMLMSGITPPLTPAQKWFASLPEQSQRDVSDVAVATAGELGPEMLMLLDELDDVVFSDEHADAIADICERRDVLEGVLYLLNFVQKSGELVASLNLLDKAVAERVKAFHSTGELELKVSTPQMLSAAVLDPDAWWVQWSV
jgi:hypothetical protein